MGSIAIVKDDLPAGSFTNKPDETDVDMTQVRDLFPIAAKDHCTYLNASLQLPMSVKVKEALDQFSALALHDPNAKGISSQVTGEVRQLIAEYLHVEEKSIAFTRDTTEGLNLFQRSIKYTPGSNVVILDNEHPNNAYGWLSLQSQGLEVRRVPTDSDALTFADANTFAPYVDDRTVAVSISSVMFHSGQMNDVKSICQEFRPRGIHVLADITQHVGNGAIDLKEWGVSAAAFSCHKGLGSPTGLGIMFVDPHSLSSLKTDPPVVGAGAIANLSSDLIAQPHILYHDSAKRFEHLNMSLVSMFALRAHLSLLLKEIGMVNVEKHLRRLGCELGLGCKKLGVAIVGSRRVSQRSPHNYVLKLFHDGWKDHFVEDGLSVSHYRAGVRVSFGIYNNLKDVQRLVASIHRGLEKGLLNA